MEEASWIDSLVPEDEISPSSDSLIRASKKEEGYASHVQLFASRKVSLTGKLGRASPPRLTSPALN
eukprot:1136941-Pelagomonas_calceolata.AAC.6